uniref:Uncharacterized protein n=1 Tax=Chromera velia CCMP2878 TaxID=1169474 RepID=A0A0G4HLM0_9ALVE|eukprot:Cvel_28866.t1-p1 / transcript=Cvel_28866.t1 / gene=Cvel_28866 / organism=Chromera_velia_CCMP2878 / gene_product=hypothetical protein / transcript_product=hypothetical protein / location=Cvel_scaffold3855:9899-11691(+) / protein_length=418 / sequence_SO=supercontig / SO=protein_coding / is_pseudo=false
MRICLAHLLAIFCLAVSLSRGSLEGNESGGIGSQSMKELLKGRKALKEAKEATEKKGVTLPVRGSTEAPNVSTKGEEGMPSWPSTDESTLLDAPAVPESAAREIPEEEEDFDEPLNEQLDEQSPSTLPPGPPYDSGEEETNSPFLASSTSKMMAEAASVIAFVVVFIGLICLCACCCKEGGGLLEVTELTDEQVEANLRKEGMSNPLQSPIMMWRYLEKTDGLIPLPFRPDCKAMSGEWKGILAIAGTTLEIDVKISMTVKDEQIIKGMPVHMLLGVPSDEDSTVCIGTLVPKTGRIGWVKKTETWTSSQEVVFRGVIVNQYTFQIEMPVAAPEHQLTGAVVHMEGARAAGLTDEDISSIWNQNKGVSVESQAIAQAQGFTLEYVAAQRAAHAAAVAAQTPGTPAPIPDPNQTPQQQP